MPSSPQIVTTRGVFDYLYNSAGKAIVGATVNCTLNFNGSSVTSPIVNLGELQQATVTDQNGFWRFNLVPNDIITPTGTLYTINAGNIASYDISVPSGGADVQSSSILANTPSVLSPAVTGLTGPITVTGNETVTGNLTVSGTTTLGSTTAGATTLGAATVGGDLTIGSAFRLLFGAAVAKIVPGATSISHRNNADSADNVLITDVGAVTVRNGFTLTAGDAVITAGRLLVSAAAAKILGGVTSLSLRNNADTADNVLVTDAGLVTLRNALSLPPAAGGTVAPTSYGTLPVKYDEQTPTGASITVPASGTIPGGFRAIRIAWYGRTTSANTGDQLNLNFNGDVTGNYDWSATSLSGAAAPGGVTALANGTQRVGMLAGGGAAANLFNSGWIEIAAYASTGNRRYLTYQCARSDAATTTDVGMASWRNTANAITSMVLAPAAGNFASGTLFITYLIP